MRAVTDDFDLDSIADMCKVRKASNIVAGYSVSIDISAKVEQWNKASAVAVSNGHSRTIRISAEIKQSARNLIGGHEPVQFALMAILAYLAIRPDLEKINRIVLDQDYSGNVAKRVIVRRLVELIRYDCPGFKASHIKIATVSGSNAYRLARQVFIGRRDPDWEVS